MEPKRPTRIPELAEMCLSALRQAGLGDLISVGGAFGLLCYHDYRSTHDVDAWWAPRAGAADRERLVKVLRGALEAAGTVRVRTWGDVISVELIDGDHRGFSFQIAQRRVQLRPSRESPWKGVWIDSFDDLVASKMVALVERGAPRDFLDIYSVCEAGLTTVDRCWELWEERSRREGSEPSFERARLAVESHLARIVRYRPLDSIDDADERRRAEAARRWYREELLDAISH